MDIRHFDVHWCMDRYPQVMLTAEQACRSFSGWKTVCLFSPNTVLENQCFFYICSKAQHRRDSHRQLRSGCFGLELWSRPDWWPERCPMNIVFVSYVGVLLFILPFIFPNWYPHLIYHPRSPPGGPTAADLLMVMKDHVLCHEALGMGFRCKTLHYTAVSETRVLV